MQFKYRIEAVQDLVWFENYYNTVFQEGSLKAKEHFVLTRNAILQFPKIGKIIDMKRQIREFTIPKTPFSFIYYLSDVEIIVLRVFDSRAIKSKINI